MNGMAYFRENYLNHFQLNFESDRRNVYIHWEELTTFVSIMSQMGMKQLSVLEATGNTTSACIWNLPNEVLCDLSTILVHPTLKLDDLEAIVTIDVKNQKN